MMIRNNFFFFIILFLTKPKTTLIFWSFNYKTFNPSTQQTSQEPYLHSIHIYTHTHTYIITKVYRLKFFFCYCFWKYIKNSIVCFSVQLNSNYLKIIKWTNLFSKNKCCFFSVVGGKDDTVRIFLSINLCPLLLFVIFCFVFFSLHVTYLVYWVLNSQFRYFYKQNEKRHFDFFTYTYFS